MILVGPFFASRGQAFTAGPCGSTFGAERMIEKHKYINALTWIGAPRRGVPNFFRRPLELDFFRS
jgi:hypothetical protein